MKNSFDINVWLAIGASFLFATSDYAVDNIGMNMKRIDKNMPMPPIVIDQLIKWPSEEIVLNKQVPVSDPDVALAKKQYKKWLNKVIDPLWLSEIDVAPLFLRDEFDGYDVVRQYWLKNDYKIEVSQTSNFFVLKLSLEDCSTTGKNVKEKFQIARNICFQVFSKQGEYMSDQGNMVTVDNLSEKIMSYSFRSELIKNIENNNIVIYGTPMITRKEEDGDKNEIRTQTDNNVNNSILKGKEEARGYWFRMIYWLNDGTNIYFIFLKAEGTGARSDIGVGMPDFAGSGGKKWFRH